MLNSVVQAEWIQIPEGFAAASTIILGSRLVLNLRSAYHKPYDDEIALHTNVAIPRTEGLRRSTAVTDGCELDSFHVHSSIDLQRATS